MTKATIHYIGNEFVEGRFRPQWDLRVEGQAIATVGSGFLYDTVPDAARASTIIEDHYRRLGRFPNICINVLEPLPCAA